MKQTPYIVIIALLLIIGGLFAFYSTPSIVTKIITRTRTITRTDTIKEDTIIYRENFKYKDRIVYIDSIIHDTIITKELIKDYIADHYYIDTLVNDSSFLFILKDTISRNKIKSRIYDYRQTVNQSINYNQGLFVGGFIASNGYGVQSVYIRNKFAYSLNYDVKNKALSVGIAYKILSR